MGFLSSISPFHVLIPMAFRRQYRVLVFKKVNFFILPICISRSRFLFKSKSQISAESRCLSEVKPIYQTLFISKASVAFSQLGLSSLTDNSINPIR